MKTSQNYQIVTNLVLNVHYTIGSGKWTKYSNRTNEIKSAFGFIHEDRIICVSDWGTETDSFKKGTKKLKSYSYDEVISERSFKIRTTKNYNKSQAEQAAKMAELAKLKEKKEAQERLDFGNLQILIASKIEVIKSLISIEVIEQRLIDDRSKESWKRCNELCNQAVGIVGYEYAKKFGWTKILREIKNIYNN